MQTSAQWWNKTKSDPNKLIAWLKDQYHGEKTASKRIVELFVYSSLTVEKADLKVVLRIAKEEEIHARWIGDLLLARGVTPEILDKEERYWNKVLPADGGQSKEQLAAIAHLAERMRLERIGVIAADPQAPKDIRAVFKKILPMELNHEKLFLSLTTDKHIKDALANHYDGLNALGLVI